MGVALPLLVVAETGKPPKVPCNGATDAVKFSVVPATAASVTAKSELMLVELPEQADKVPVDPEKTGVVPNTSGVVLIVTVADEPEHVLQFAEFNIEAR